MERTEFIGVINNISKIYKDKRIILYARLQKLAEISFTNYEMENNAILFYLDGQCVTDFPIPLKEIRSIGYEVVRL